MLDNVRILKLENSELSVCVIPKLGGKICSLRDKKTDYECMFQNPKSFYACPTLYDSFADYDASGFDDAFPNIDESFSEINGRTVHFPDHGEIWTMPMTARAEQQAVHLTGAGRVLPCRYGKTVALEGRSLRVSYDIQAIGTEPLPFFWTLHCLVNVDEHTRLIFPDHPSQAENVLAGTDLGKVGTILDLNAPVPDLRRMPPRGEKAMRKYYLKGQVDRGLCGYEFAREKLRLMIAYDQKVLPYLGVWCTMGGFRGDVNAALEPSSAYYDSIDVAKARGTLPMLMPGEHKCFELVFTLSDL